MHSHVHNPIIIVIVVNSSSADTRQLVGHSGPVYSTSFSPDNTFLLSASEDGTSMCNNTPMCRYCIATRLSYVVEQMN